MRIMLTGPSGVGKTTISNEIIKMFPELQFISGSYSDLVATTRYKSHEEMIMQSSSKIFTQDVELVYKRHFLLDDQDMFITDRSYIDSIAYMINKLSHRVSICEMEEFIHTCIQSFYEQCDMLVFLPFTIEMVTNFPIEANNKRILNPWYQVQISLLIQMVIEYLLQVHWTQETTDFKIGVTPINNVNVIMLTTYDLNTRLSLLDSFIQKDYYEAQANQN